jgi:hypothetical protein
MSPTLYGPECGLPGPIYTPFHEKRNQSIGQTFEQCRDDAAKGTLFRLHDTPDVTEDLRRRRVSD